MRIFATVHLHREARKVRQEKLKTFAFSPALASGASVALSLAPSLICLANQAGVAVKMVHVR